jgi:DNA repair photolyase
MHLIGIAKTAASAPVLNAKRQVEYRELVTGQWINRVESSRFSFQWSINPYRGCEMACVYCYARYTHEFMQLDGGRDFASRIFAKAWNARDFRAELQRIPRGEGIAIGTATDPYQHAERRFGITRRMLEEFSRRSGLRLWITTKSDLITRDLDVLEKVRWGNLLYVNFTVTTLDANLARRLEPGAPRPDLRLRALVQLVERGISCGVIASPVMPGINDAEEQLGEIAVAAKQAGASWFGGGGLFLKSPTRESFQRFLQEEKPELVETYQRLLAVRDHLPVPLRQKIEQRFIRLRGQHGLSNRAKQGEPPGWRKGEQLKLAWNV